MIKIINFIKLLWIKLTKEVQKDKVPMYIIKKYISKASDYSEILDSDYTTCDLETLKLIVKLIPIRKQKYSTTHDCNKFAYEFYALIGNLFPTLACGVCHVKTSKGLHALNWVIYKNNVGGFTFSYLEPQTGKISYFNYKSYFMVI